MRAFRDQKAAELAIQRIESQVHTSLEPLLETGFERCPHPDNALLHLERWLKVAGSPDLIVQHLIASPKLAQILIGLLGSSQLIAAILEQNPELGSLALDPEELLRPLEAAPMRAEGKRLIEGSTSYRHTLDRLRFLKQKAVIKIALADAIGLWSPPQVWRALSTASDVIIALAREASWDEYRQGKDLPEECPVTIVGMGKLGGEELNFSSDVDLIYVVDDEATPEVEKHVPRFCEKFRRALSDRMFRGTLYRVDLRLRPFGASGPVASKMKTIEAYYEKFAEPWEHLALIRSRAIAGDPDVIFRWRAVREKTTFKPSRGEWAISSILDMRERLEDRSIQDDIKRAAGGIRDAEFVVQIMQMLHGPKIEELRGAETLSMLQALAKHKLLPEKAITELGEGYTMLRVIEHHCQIAADQQTHEIPKDIEDREELARRLGFSGLNEFETRLSLCRSRIRHWYANLLGPFTGSHSHQEVLDKFGPAAGDADAWISALPDSDAFWSSLAENESSLDRFRQIATYAPALIPWLKQAVAITEQVMTGEINEPFDPAEPIKRIDATQRVPEAAMTIRRGWLRIGARWALDQSVPYGSLQAQLVDAVLTRLREQAKANFSIIALGSLGACEMTVSSDADLLLLQHSESDVMEDEEEARRLLGLIRALRTAGAPIEADLRLRPEGKTGRLATSAEGFRRYAQTRLQPWEKMALSRHRRVVGDEAAVELLRDLVLKDPVTQEEFKSLLSMKTRIEDERVGPLEAQRSLKLGAGGMDDIVWLNHFNVLCSPHLRRDLMTTENGLALCVESGLIDQNGASAMQDAWDLMTVLRMRLGLLGLRDDVMPSEPDKLQLLAEAMGCRAGDLVAQVHEAKSRVRAIYRSGVSQLEKSWS